MEDHLTLCSSIEEVSRDTGIGKDTLRVWERRYGFPEPMRNSQGERSYPEAQQRRLRIICRLLDRGYRPGKVVTLPLEQLALLDNQPQKNDTHLESSVIEPLLRIARSGQASELKRTLEQLLERQGPHQFILATVAPLLQQTGTAWANGQLPIYVEHLISHQLSSVLNSACSSISLNTTSPRVLLTTVPGEPHSIGLAMVELLLRLEGFAPLSLGVETPVDQIIAACLDLQPQALALSFSALQKRPAVIAALQELSNKIPESVVLLAGGRGVEKLRSLPERIRIVKKLEQLRSSLPVIPEVSAKEVAAEVGSPINSV